jgi:hypothetical protein
MALDGIGIGAAPSSAKEMLTLETIQSAETISKHSFFDRMIQAYLLK